MAKGTIRKLIADRGYGFIKGENGRDVFFHRSELQGVEYGHIREEQEVEFEMARGQDGRSQAVKVRLSEAEVKEELPSAEETIETAEAVEDDSTEAP